MKASEHSPAISPQFGIADIFVSPLTHRQVWSEAERQLIWQRTEQPVTTTGVDVLDAIRRELVEGRKPSRLARQWGVRPDVLSGLTLLLTGMNVQNLTLAWRQYKIDHLLRYTDLPLKAVARHCQVCSAQALNNIVRDYANTTPEQRRQQLQQPGDDRWTIIE